MLMPDTHFVLSYRLRHRWFESSTFHHLTFFDILEQKKISTSKRDKPGETNNRWPKAQRRYGGFARAQALVRFEQNFFLFTPAKQRGNTSGWRRRAGVYSGGQLSWCKASGTNLKVDGSNPSPSTLTPKNKDYGTGSIKSWAQEYAHADRLWCRLRHWFVFIRLCRPSAGEGSHPWLLTFNKQHTTLWN